MQLHNQPHLDNIRDLLFVTANENALLRSHTTLRTGVGEESFLSTIEAESVKARILTTHSKNTEQVRGEERKRSKKTDQFSNNGDREITREAELHT